MVLSHDSSYPELPSLEHLFPSKALNSISNCTSFIIMAPSIEPSSALITWFEKNHPSQISSCGVKNKQGKNLALNSGIEATIKIEFLPYLQGKHAILNFEWTWTGYDRCFVQIWLKAFIMVPSIKSQALLSLMDLNLSNRSIILLTGQSVVLLLRWL